MGDPQFPEIGDYKAKVGLEGMVAENISVYQPNPDGSGQGARVTYTYRVLRPLTAYFIKTSDGPSFAAYFTISPIEERVCQGWMRLAMNYSTVYVENVAEGADSEQVIRSLARKGFDVIFTTSFGFMDASEIVAEEFPDVEIIHINGYKSNEANFGNLYGAMEDMKYLAGMIAGSRAKMDGNPHVGTLLTFPLAEQIRHGNAFALGVQETCPECVANIRWILTWHDPIIEREAAASLFDAGAQVVTSDADTPAPAEAAPEGK